jgi:hypothetical protein
MTVSFTEACMLSVPRYSMGLKLTTRESAAIPRTLGLLILKVADDGTVTAGSLLAFFEHSLMSFYSPCDARY